MLPFFPFGMHFYNSLWLSTIFLIFSILNKHEQTSWFQTMEFKESTHAKLIRALVGVRHSRYFPKYCLFDCASSMWIHEIVYTYYWANLISHFSAQLAVQVCSLPPHFPKFRVYACHCPVWCHTWLSWYLFDCLIIFDEDTCCVIHHLS